MLKRANIPLLFIGYLNVYEMILWISDQCLSDGTSIQKEKETICALNDYC